MAFFADRMERWRRVGIRYHCSRCVFTDTVCFEHPWIRAVLATNRPITWDDAQYWKWCRYCFLPVYAGSKMTPVFSQIVFTAVWRTILKVCSQHMNWTKLRGVVGRGRGGWRLPLFWTEIRAKVSSLLQLVTNWNAMWHDFSTTELISIC